VPKKKSDVALQIILHLKGADRPLIANHIAKGTKIRPQLIDYHLKKLLNKGVVLVQREYGHYYYFLQPSFYLEEAETALMKILIPWVEVFAKRTEVTKGQKKDQVVYNNLNYYFQIFLKNIQKI